jgi:hypothetical protein
MEIKRLICDKCKKEIKDLKGISIEGNIYVPDLTKGGLIGDNFKMEMGKIIKVNRNDFCIACFIECMHEEFRNEIKIRGKL